MELEHCQAKRNEDWGKRSQGFRQKGVWKLSRKNVSTDVTENGTWKVPCKERLTIIKHED